MCFDMLMGVFFVVLLFDYLLIKMLVQICFEIVVFCEECCCIGMIEEVIEIVEKLGFDIGLKVCYLFDLIWELLIWIVNFVLMDYGIGVIFGSFVYDECDYEFVIKYGLLICVIFGEKGMDQVQVDVLVVDVFFVLLKLEIVIYVCGFVGKVDQIGEDVVVVVIVYVEVVGYGQGVIKFWLCDWGILC